MPHQVSVFAENKPGKIEKVTQVLSEGNINIRAITIADAGDYGIIKLLLDNPITGCEMLKARGLSATLKEVVAVEITDKVGGLHLAALCLTKHGINVIDAYGFIVERKAKAVFVFQVENAPKAEKILKDEGFSILSDAELYVI